MRKILSLVILTLIPSGCVTPGMEEPSLFVYTITDKGLSGYHSDNSNERREITFVDGIGFTCVSPDGQAQIKTHHQILHEELNKDERRRNSASVGR